MPKTKASTPKAPAKTAAPKWISVLGGRLNLPDIGQDCVVACYDPNETRVESARYRIERMRYWSATLSATAQGYRWMLSFGPSPQLASWLWVTHWMPAPALPPKEEMSAIGKELIEINDKVSSVFPINDDLKSESMLKGMELLNALLHLRSRLLPCETCVYQSERYLVTKTMTLDACRHCATKEAKETVALYPGLK